MKTPWISGLNRENFDVSWRSNAWVGEIPIADAMPLIMQHYLHTKPGTILLCFGLKVKSHLIGVITYSAPCKPLIKYFGGIVWELSRLYMLDFIPRNSESFFIGKTIKYIKKHHPYVLYLLSYADSEQGHEGTIYEASNWIFDGMSKPGKVYKDKVTGKTYQPRRIPKQNANIILVDRTPKYRYYYPMHKDC